MKKYRIGDRVFDDINNVFNYCIEDNYHKDDDYFEEWLNESYSSVTIAGCTFYPYDILRQCDYYTFEQELDHYCEQQNEDDIERARYELEHADAGDEVEIQNQTVEIIIVPDEEDEEVEEIHVDTIEELRIRLEQNRMIKEEAVKEAKKNEFDLLQIIGG